MYTLQKSFNVLTKDRNEATEKDISEAKKSILGSITAMQKGMDHEESVESNKEHGLRLWLIREHDVNLIAFCKYFY